MRDTEQQILVPDVNETVVSPNGNRRGRRGTRGNRTTPATRQSLGATIKSVRDKLRQDAGLSGDTDRLPQLTWLLFLKLLDDFEMAREEEQGDEYEPIIKPPYRWRDWAAVGQTSDRMTGDELIDFVNDELLPHLAQISSTDQRDLRTIVGTVFQGTYNRIRSGYILRQVVDELDTLDLNASEDIHAVSHFYETMLREMRDAAGDSGEFYTPRPVVRFIIDRLKPQLGERILDPACGTGGFMVEAYERLKSEARTPEQRRRLQDDIRGMEKKPMPYLLGVVNLLLHGIERPNVIEGNALQTNVSQIKDDERVHVIATNPPFGGEEEPGILNNFPQGLRTRETAVLFVQYVMAMLHRGWGRCGIILPNGFLFGDGIASQVKKRLVERFNLHTIVRLPSGVFAPYAPILTNLLFFDAGGSAGDEPCTREIWYYELSPPEGRKSYSKMKPLQFEEFADCIAWWDNRVESERAWRIPIEQIIENGYNLDLKNPNAGQDSAHISPEQLVEEILTKEMRIVELMRQLRQALAEAAR
jgi:type I restriction enzyme M protein